MKPVWRLTAVAVMVMAMSAYANMNQGERKPVPGLGGSPSLAASGHLFNPLYK